MVRTSGFQPANTGSTPVPSSKLWGYRLMVGHRIVYPNAGVRFSLAPPLIAVWIYFAVTMTAGMGS